MGKFAKVLVFLEFLLILAFMFFSLKTTAKINSQRAMIGALRKGSSDQGQTIQSLQGVLSSASSTVGSLRTDKRNLTADLNQTRSDLADERVARANAEGERDAARQAQQVAENERDAEKQARQTAESQLATARQEITRLTGELSTTQSQVAKLTEDLAGANGMIANLEREKRTLKDRLTAEMAKTDPGIASKRIAELNGELAASKSARENAVSAKSDAERLMVAQRNRADGLQQKLDKLKLSLSRRFGKTPEAVPPEIRELYKESMDELIEEKKGLQVSLEAQRSELAQRDKVIGDYKQSEIRRLAAEKISPQKMLRADKGSVVALADKGVIGLGFEGLSVPERGDVFHATRGGRIVGKATVSDVYRTIVVFRVNPGIANKYIEVGDLVSRPGSEQ